MALRRSGVLVRGAPVEWRRIPGIGWPGLAGAAGVASRGGEEGGGRGQAADAERCFCALRLHAPAGRDTTIWPAPRPSASSRLACASELVLFVRPG
jgi:hypothetical protein